MTKKLILEKAFHWRLAYSFSDLVHSHHGGEHSGRRGRQGPGSIAESYKLIFRKRKRE